MVKNYVISVISLNVSAHFVLGLSLYRLAHFRICASSLEKEALEVKSSSTVWFITYRSGHMILGIRVDYIKNAIRQGYALLH